MPGTKFFPIVHLEIHIELAARPPPGGDSGGPSGPRPSACNYPTGSYGARPDYQTGMCRCKVWFRS